MADQESGCAKGVLHRITFGSNTPYTSRRNADAFLPLEHRASGVADHVTLSVGATSTIPDGSLGAEDLIHLAGQALYQAKHSGRNRAVVVRR